MTKFREFYVPPGAGSNFLANKCMWASDIKSYKSVDNVSTNEFFYHREKVNNTTIEETLFSEDFTNEDLISETKEIKSILLELESNIPAHSTIINSIEDLWRRDWSYYLIAFSDQQIQDYFIRCREYYFEVCESMNWNSSIITHLHPHIAISSQLKLPKNFKSLAMELDSKTTMFMGALGDIKSDNYEPNAYTNNVGNQSDENFRCVQNSDDSVSYRKIFFENNVEEIRRMYDFFGNVKYFDENKMVIMKEFKDYHNNNMIVIKDFMSLFYERIKSR